MANRAENLPCVTINPDGTVRIIMEGRTVDLSYADYVIARESGKSPFSRVFSPRPVQIVKLSGEPDEND